MKEPDLSVYSAFLILFYVWYCNIGAAKFAWWLEFIRNADRLLLYHSSSADIPKKKKH